MVRYLWNLFWNAAKEFQADGCQMLAAGISYYLIFSLFPLLIFAAGAAGMFLSDHAQQRIVNEVLDTLSLDQGGGRNAVTEAVRSIAGSGGRAIGLVGLITMAWSSSALFGALRKALNVAFDEVETAKRPFVQQKLIDLGLVLAVTVFFVASIAATALFRAVRNRSEDLPLGALAESLGFFWDVASYLVPLSLSFVAFTAVYCIVPSRVRRPREVWPGALCAAVVFELGKFGLSIYIEHFSNYDVVFGSLGAVVAFLFWLYVSSNIMLFGAEVASEYPRVLQGAYDEVELEGIKPPFRKRVLRALKGLFVRQEDEAQPLQGNGRKRGGA